MKLHPLPRLSRYSLALLLGLSLLRAESPPAWQEEAREQGLNAAEIKILAEQNMVITGMEVPQIFSPYADLTMPVFITSDTVISGFNALLQESMRLLELRQAAELQPLLNLLQTRIGEREAVLLKAYQPAELAPVGIKRARLILATAQVLLGAGKQVPASLREEAQSTAARLEKAQGIVFPEWLGRPSPEFLGMNAETFKPLSFYAEQPALARYFRAVTMLQSAALMISDDASIVAASVLGNAMRGGDHEWEEDRKRQGFFDFCEAFFGSPETLSANDIGSSASGDHLLTANSEHCSVAERRAEMIRFAEIEGSSWSKDHLAQLSLRVWPSSQVPDNEYFRLAGSRKGTDRDKVSIGIEIAAALNAKSAISERGKLLGKEEMSRIETAVKQSNFLPAAIAPSNNPTSKNQAPGQSPTAPTDITSWSGPCSVYQSYLACLSLLVDPKEPDAPEMFNSSAWQAKSCQTLMTGWAQMRHNMALAVRAQVFSIKGPPMVSGYVEPEPTFFKMMASLGEDSQAKLESLGTFEVSDAMVIESVQADLAALAVKGAFDPMRLPFDVESEKLWVANSRMLNAPWPKGLEIPIFQGMEYLKIQEVSYGEGEKAESAKAELNKILADYTAKCEAWQTKVSAWWNKRSAEGVVSPSWRKVYSQSLEKLRGRWLKFRFLCLRLESIAHRQLRGVPQLKVDSNYIFGFGKSLREIMGFADITPDDAPLCALITHDPQSGVYLHAGIARPRLFYILYPGKSGAVLLRGAVNCYDERATGSPLTDKEWMNYQNQWPKAPATWLQVISPDELPRRGK